MTTAYDMKRTNAKYDILTVPNPEDGSISYIWEESDIAVRLSEITQNHQGLTADFTAECPIGTDVKSGIKVYLDKDSSRKATIKAMHDPALGLVFKEWEPMVENAFSKTVKLYRQTKEDSANELPKALSADDILAMETPSTPYLIKDILTISGTTIIASLPKKGKTLFVLNIVKASQSRERFLDRDVPEVPFLILALEDTTSRLKTRLTTLGISGRQINFILTCDLTQGLEPLKRLIEKFEPRIVVIDTLLAALHVKDENSPEFGIAAQQIHDLARDMNVSILILHHHGKSKRDDPILDLRGHTSLSGAVDVILGLYPEETPGQFKLKSASRDGESIDLDLSFDNNSLKWCIDKGFSEGLKAEADQAMLDLLGELGPSTIEAIGQANGKTRPINDKVLKRIMESGDIARKAQKVGYQVQYVYQRTR